MGDDNNKVADSIFDQVEKELKKILSDLDSNWKEFAKQNIPNDNPSSSELQSCFNHFILVQIASLILIKNKQLNK